MILEPKTFSHFFSSYIVRSLFLSLFSVYCLFFLLVVCHLLVVKTILRTTPQGKELAYYKHTHTRWMHAALCRVYYTPIAAQKIWFFWSTHAIKLPLFSSNVCTMYILSVVLFHFFNWVSIRLLFREYIKTQIW